MRIQAGTYRNQEETTRLTGIEHFFAEPDLVATPEVSLTRSFDFLKEIICLTIQSETLTDPGSLYRRSADRWDAGISDTKSLILQSAQVSRKNLTKR